MFAFGDTEWPGLAKLAEESGELVQVIGKLMMTHGRAKHWEGSDLRWNLVKEMADVSAALSFVEVYALTAKEREAYDARCIEKFALFEQWHQEQWTDDPLKAEVERRVLEETEALRERYEIVHRTLLDRNEEIIALKLEQETQAQVRAKR